MSTPNLARSPLLRQKARELEVGSPKRSAGAGGGNKKLYPNEV
jgi:hypothetical protein